jgi:hypothetical protein
MVIFGGKELAEEFPLPGEKLDGDAAAKNLAKGRCREMDGVTENESI